MAAVHVPISPGDGDTLAENFQAVNECYASEMRRDGGADVRRMPRVGARGPARRREEWHPWCVAAQDEHEWLTLPDLAERFGLPIGKVRRLLEDRYLVAVRTNGVLRVPAEFLDEEGPLHDLRGTVILLADSGYTDAQAVEWLLGEDGSLGTRPIDALRAGRKAEVRRVAQALAF
jgi:hypothetical protein